MLVTRFGACTKYFVPGAPGAIVAAEAKQLGLIGVLFDRVEAPEF